MSEADKNANQPRDVSDPAAPQPEESGQPAIQFQLSTIFVLVLISGIMSAFLQSRGEENIPAALATVTVIAIFAIAVGSFRPPLTDRLFWGIVVTAMMQAIAAEVVLLDRFGVLGWPICAGIAAVCAAGRTTLYPRMIIGAIPAGIAMAIYSLTFEAPVHAKAMNVVSATIGGALLGMLIELILWVQSKRILPQPAIGLALVLGGIVFAVTAPKIIPGW